ncbi:MAG: glutamate racemase [bacterium]|nr:glutamate racemase [bacterium]
MTQEEKAIAVFDSGVGGISVLRELVKLMPNENFIYYGDSAHAPYGTKSIEEVYQLSIHNIEKLAQQGIKAVVIACNTVTSVAIDDLRDKYRKMPIIGVEPALKPAVLHKKDGRVLVMATPITIHEHKFSKLMDTYQRMAEVIPLPCGGLADLVEAGKVEGEEVEDYLGNLLAPYVSPKLDAIVLGCTHYPFAKEAIAKVVGYDVEFFDGGVGTAKETERRLKESGLLNPSKEKGKVTMLNSLNDERMIELSYYLLEK